MIETQLVEMKEIVDGLEVKYMFKPATLDVEHLVIVFSGYGWNSLFTYDFAGDSLKDIPSNILWIKDDFGGAPCYYMCKHRDFSIEEKIIKFIEKKIRFLSLSNSDVTVLGCSKGATAALYYGIKYSFRNVISIAPQIDLGDFLNKGHKETRSEMFDQDKSDNITFFNNIIYNTVDACASSNTNLCIAYSDCDEYQISYTKIIGTLKNKCNELSCLNINSLVVKTHNRICPYITPFIKSVLLQNSYHISPIFGYKEFGVSIEKKITQELRDIQVENECYLEKVNLNQRYLKLRIVSFHRFSNDLNKGSIFLCFDSAVGLNYKFELKNVDVDEKEQAEISRKYFKYQYYNVGKFIYEPLKEIDMACIEPSLYEISVMRVINGKTVKFKIESTDCKMSLLLNRYPNLLGKIFTYSDKSVKLFISQSISNRSPDVFKLTRKVVDKSSLYYEGFFIKYDLICNDYSDLDFYMVMHNVSNNTNNMIRMRKLPEDNLNKYLNGKCLVSKCKFAPMNSKKIDIKSLELSNGDYEVYISMIPWGSYVSQLYSYKVANIKVKDNQICAHNESNEKENEILIYDLDRLSIDDMLVLDNYNVELSILNYINYLSVPINYAKYIKVTDYLRIKKLESMLQLINMKLQILLNNDLYDELKS